MADAQRELKVVINSDTAQAEQGLSHFAGSIGKTLKDNVVQLGAAFAAVTGVIYSSIAAYQESEAVLAQTDAVLKSTAGAAGMSRDALIDLSKALQQQTTYSDEAVLSTENLLLTFTNIHKETFPLATKAVLDMSTALGEDTKSAAIQLGKALQDPILGITALRRVGVAFTESQKEQIKTLVESGQTLQAQQMILKEISTEFGGSATAAAQTYAGQMEQLKNNVNDLQEILGKGFLDTLNQVSGGMGGISEKVKELNDFLTKHQDILKATIVAILIVAAAFGALFVAALVAVAGIAGLVILAIGAIAAVIGFLGTMIYLHWGQIKAKTEEVWNGIVNTFNNVKKAIITFISDFVTGLTVAFNNFKSFIEHNIKDAENAVILFFTKTIPNALLEAVIAFQLFIINAGKFLYQLFFTDIPFIVGFALGWLQKNIPLMIDSVVNWFSQLPGRIGKFLSDFANNIVTTTTQTGTSMTNEVSTWPSRVYSYLTGLVNLAAQALIELYNSFVSWITNTWTWVSTEVSAWPGRVKSFLDSIPGIVKKILDDLNTTVDNALHIVWNTATSWWIKIKDIFDSIVKAANNAIQTAEKAFSAGVKTGKNATGTTNWTGGLTWVGESGPELVSLPAGTAIHSAGESQKIATNSTNSTVNVTINNPSISNQLDIDNIIDQIKKSLGRDNELVRLGAL